MPGRGILRAVYLRAAITVMLVITGVPLLQGCGAIGKLHTQAGVLVGNNFGDESVKGFSETQGVAELGYVPGGMRTETPAWSFGGTGYVTLADPMRPGIKAIARRRFNRTASLDFSAGPMITYDSSGLFNGFTGGVALNVSFLTLRSEYMSWPTEPWDEYDYYQANGVPTVAQHHGSGHEQVWFNGVSMNGTASWVVVAVTTGLFIIAAANGAFE